MYIVIRNLKIKIIIFGIFNMFVYKMECLSNVIIVCVLLKINFDEYEIILLKFV